MSDLDMTEEDEINCSFMVRTIHTTGTSVSLDVLDKQQILSFTFAKKTMDILITEIWPMYQSIKTRSNETP